MEVMNGSGECEWYLSNFVSLFIQAQKHATCWDNKALSCLL